MNSREAWTVVTELAAWYTRLPPSKEDLENYIRKLTLLDASGRHVYDAEIARASIADISDRHTFFPSWAEFREAYAAAKRHDQTRQQAGVEKAPPFEPSKRARAKVSAQVALDIVTRKLPKLEGEAFVAEVNRRLTVANRHTENAQNIHNHQKKDK